MHLASVNDIHKPYFLFYISDIFMLYLHFIFMISSAALCGRQIDGNKRTQCQWFICWWLTCDSPRHWTPTKFFIRTILLIFIFIFFWYKNNIKHSAMVTAIRWRFVCGTVLHDTSNNNIEHVHNSVRSELSTIVSLGWCFCHVARHVKPLATFVPKKLKLDLVF